MFQKIPIQVKAIFIKLGLATFFILLLPNQVFAAAGGGTTIGGSGGGCTSSISGISGNFSTWDTCFGGTWRYYRLDRAIPIRHNKQSVDVTYDKSNDRLEILDASTNTKGGVISGCDDEGSTGFFKFGLEVYEYRTSATWSASNIVIAKNYQAGLIQKGTIRNALEVYPSKFYAQNTYNEADVVAHLSNIPAFISSLPHGAVFENSAVRRLFHYLEENGKNHGPDGTIYTWNNAALAWFCTGVFEEEAEFSSRSNIGIDGSSNYETTNWVDKKVLTTPSSAQPNSNISVRFSHDMKYAGDLTVNGQPASTPYSYSLSVNGVNIAPSNSYSFPLGVGTATVSATTTPPQVNGTFTPSNNSAVAVIPSHSYSISIPDFDENTSGQFTICETITYQNKKYDDKSKQWVNGPSYSKICAAITVKAESFNEVSECPLLYSSYSLDKGGTQAASAVRNKSVGNTWQQTTENNHTAVVWAKPGDSIQFKHTLCFGAQAVRGSSNPGGKGSSTPTDRPILPSVANSATIRAFTTPTTSANYLFGKTLTGNNSQTFNLTRGSDLPSAVSGADEKGKYFFTYYSPSQKVGNTYECTAEDRGYLGFVNNGYQIPGFSSSTKPNSCKSPAVSDVGKTIEQDLEWLDVKSWVNQYSSGGSTDCDCDDDGYTSPSILSVSYNTDTSGYSSGRHILGCYSNGRCGCCGEYCTSCKTQYSTTDYWYHPISTTSNPGNTKKAQVKIPYNYTTNVEASISSLGGVVFAGEDNKISASVRVNARSDNPEVPGNYATISKPTSYEVVVFTIPASTWSMPSHLQGKNNHPRSSDYRACSYYGVADGQCQSVRRESNVYLNDTGNLNGSEESLSLLSTSMNIPDLEIGTKYCVALAVFPSNSHDSISRPPNNGIAMMDTGATWNYSKASCVTIAKKPSVHFYNSEIYTKGGISTSISKKKVPTTNTPENNIPWDNTPCNFSSSTRYSSGNCGASDSNDNRRVFGSWAEYSVLAKAKNSIKNFASGAAFGYERNNGGSYSTPGGYIDVGYQSEPNACTYSTQTFNNAACREKTLGTATINPANINLDRLLARYTSSSSPAIRPTGSNYSVDLSGSCILGSDSKYFPSKDGHSQYTGASYTCLSNGSKYIKIEGNARTSNTGDWFCLGAASEQDTRTVVIDVSGNLTVNNNFMYGNNTSGGCSSATYTNISELPQLLIFAKNINIAENVTNIDAWLIADKGQGTINTCSSVTSYSQLDSTKCASQLRINGPVFAGKLLLNRSYGALGGHSSILPAEIFNLRNDTYYWSYSQAQRFSQSVTVYSSELAPRF